MPQLTVQEHTQVTLHVSHFAGEGTVHSKKHDYPYVVATNELECAIVGAFDVTPHMSVRRAARLFSVSTSTVRKALKSHAFRPYKMQLVHAMNEDDYARRVQFCIDELSRIEANPLHLQFLLFSDEATFHINGHVNRHNCRYWSRNNPNLLLEQPVQSPKTTVWCGLWREGIVGPFFFDGTVPGENYLTMLQREFLPEFASLHMQKEVCIFMQDGAPPHFASEVRDWLTETSPGRWMGRGSPTMPWPARSPELTPCDFFL
ncbi:uncharacterized protein LOC135384831 [Ornithodoros turicata]|uniref:uncharacterized protein LOC135384831 n=1 Tax=Ornithodoros turicata TaxID=34597 RepID=UPI003139CB66